jgi:hypothetical protein
MLRSEDDKDEIGENWELTAGGNAVIVPQSCFSGIEFHLWSIIMGVVGGK